MKLLSLGTPVLVLGLVLLLQRMEAWSAGVSTAAGRSQRHRDGRTSPTTTGRTMSTPAAPSSSTAMGEDAAEPLPRDPPAPPGYVDPLEGNATLEHLVEALAGQERTPALRSADGD